MGARRARMQRQGLLAASALGVCWQATPPTYHSAAAACAPFNSGNFPGRCGHHWLTIAPRRADGKTEHAGRRHGTTRRGGAFRACAAALGGGAGCRGGERLGRHEGRRPWDVHDQGPWVVVACRGGAHPPRPSWRGAAAERTARARRVAGGGAAGAAPAGPLRAALGEGEPTRRLFPTPTMLQHAGYVYIRINVEP